MHIRRSLLVACHLKPVGLIINDARSPQSESCQATPRPCTLLPRPLTLHPTPYMLHPTPSPYTITLHPAPYAITLHPITYTITLHPTPYTIYCLLESNMLCEAKSMEMKADAVQIQSRWNLSLLLLQSSARAPKPANNMKPANANASVPCQS